MKAFCEHCQNGWKVPRAYAGTKVKCPKCKSTVTLSESQPSVLDTKIPLPAIITGLVTFGCLTLISSWLFYNGFKNEEKPYNREAVVDSDNVQLQLKQLREIPQLKDGRLFVLMTFSQFYDIFCEKNNLTDLQKESLFNEYYKSNNE